MEVDKEFKCVFCNEAFHYQEELKVHFRKHGDPEYNNKKRRPSDEKPSTEISKDAVDMVECDVCDKVFTSISKAITHKHKTHPNHAGKHFCPWCGKLFTMKYLYNKHLEKNHSDMEPKSDDKYFHCDICNVDFNIVAAMMYHNKFFHRQENDLPNFGYSKKLKMYNQEVAILSYCPFCGEEYENKINLYNHVTKEHGGENQSPDCIFKCPLCDAIFYHLDAYELHLMHHSEDDVYGEKNVVAEAITDFSLESVPPFPEQVKNLPTFPAKKNDNNIETMSIDQLLEIALDEPKDKKKKKKHKKSKKNAITLDEFLNMNKDVFGEEIDFQGIEEVPTQVVAKKLKTKKIPTKMSPDIEKLKKQGIVVKKKIPNLIGNVIKTVGVKNITQTQSTATKPNNPGTSNEVLSKLLKQPNSQIKITKKSNNESKPTEEKAPADDHVEENNANVDEMEETEDTGCTDKEDSEEGIDHETNEELEPANSSDNAKNNDALSEIQNAQINPQKEENLLKLQEESNKKQIVDVPSKSKNMSDSINRLKSNNSIVMKSSIQFESSNEEYSDNDDFNNSEVMHNLKEEVCSEDDTDHPEEKTNTLQALKHLSHLTVKSTTPVKPVLQSKELVVKKEADTNTQEQKKIQNPKQQIRGKLNTPLKVKVTNKIPETEYYDNATDEEFEEHAEETTNKISNMLNNPHLTVKQPKSMPPKEIVNQKDHKEKTTLVNQAKIVRQAPMVLKQEKKLSILPKVPPNVAHMRNTFKKPSIPSTDNIEVFNIDDSDEEEVNNSEPISKPNTTESANKSIDALKSLNKNLTIKSLKPNGTPTVKKEIQSDEDDNCSDDFDPPDNAADQKPPPKPQMKQNIVNNVLKNLSKNITVKSRTSSPQQTGRELARIEDTPQEDYEPSDPESEPETHPQRLQIKDVTNMSDEELNDDDIDNSHENAKVKHPDDSQSETEDQFDPGDYPMTDSDFDDIDEQLLKKNNVPTNQNLGTLKKISKDITIKSSAQSANKNVSHNPIGRKIGPQIVNRNLNQPSNSLSQCQTNQMMSQQNKSSSNQVNTKEVKTVKTYKTQTETIVEEVTTTVTKTVKTVNQTMNQVLRNQTGQATIIRPQIRGMRPTRPPRSYQGVKVRQSVPFPRIRNAPVQNPRPAFNTRSPNQIVAVRPALISPHAMNQRLQMANSPQKNIRGPFPNAIGKPVKIASGAANTSLKSNTARNTEDNGHFSCFKKPKESLIPCADVSGSKGETVQFSSVQMNKSNYSCTTKSVKGNSVVMSSQVKSEMSTSSQLSKLRNMSGLVVKSNQMKQGHVEEKSEVTTNRTLEAIQKLQSQGLLVKKPRLSVSEESEHSNPGSDEMGPFSNDEMDE